MNFGKKGTLRFIDSEINNPTISNMGYILTLVDVNGEMTGEDAIKLSKRWPNVKNEYRKRYINKYGKVNLGEHTNCMLQTSVYSISCFVLKDGQLNVEALESCFKNILKDAKNDQASVHIEKNDHWDTVSPLIEKIFIENGISANIYKKNLV